jgi:putative membrane protein
MKIGGLIGIIVGLGLSAWLLESYGVGRILDLLGHAGWFGILSVIAFHFAQILFSAMAWAAIASGTPARPTLWVYCVMRWIREAANNLLPVAQIGGEFVAARLLQRRGMKLAPTIAGTVADLTMEMLTQIAFTLLGLALLLHSVGGDSSITNYVISGIVVAMAVAACFLGAQWLGLAAAIEKGLMRIGRSMGWAGTAKVEGLHKALIACYRSPRRMALAFLWHAMSWLLGGVEVCLALHFLGHDVGIGPGLVIESIGQALKAVGFAVPGALGVQEGGLIIICQAFGLSPEVAIALSLMKRVREVALGVPGLLAWQRMEARPALAAAISLPGAVP